MTLGCAESSATALDGGSARRVRAGGGEDMSKWHLSAFALGWLLSAGGLAIRWSVPALAITIAWFALTVFAVSQRNLPARSKVLAASPVGPLLLVLWSRLADTEAILERTFGAVNVTVGLMVAGGAMLALLFAWLFRCYGIIPLVATVLVVLRRQGLFEDLANYPPRLWWVASVSVLAVSVLWAAGLALLAYWVGRPPQI